MSFFSPIPTSQTVFIIRVVSKSSSPAAVQESAGRKCRIDKNLGGRGIQIEIKKKTVFFYSLAEYLKFSPSVNCIHIKKNYGFLYLNRTSLTKQLSFYRQLIESVCVYSRARNTQTSHTQSSKKKITIFTVIGSIVPARKFQLDE